MTGLDKILAQIKSQSDETCSDIFNRAQDEAAAIISESEKKAAEILEKGNADALLKSKDIITRAESSARIQNRSMLLETKQECIASALEAARLYIIGLPDDEYFSLILKMASRCSEEKSGVISFNQRDLDRLPADFSKRLSDCVKGEISVSEKSIPIDGGFILSYGDIEHNCAFLAIFADNNENFSDEVSKILF